MDRSISKNGTTALILKAVGIFGGTQALTVLCSVVRTKLAALWIGPVGVGIITLYNSTVEMLQQVSQLNIRQSSVRDISSATTDQARVAVAHVVRRISIMLGVLGLVLTVLFSPLLSRWTFGGWSHTVDFLILAPVIFLSAVSCGEFAILQGMGELKRLAKASLCGTVAGVCATLPMIYFWRMEGILPLVVTYLICNYLAVSFFKVRLPEVEHRIGWFECLRAGKKMIVLGIYMTVSSALSAILSYLFAIYLNHQYGTAEVGLYQSGFTLVNAYVGMIFTAIAMEYYPRLSSVVGSMRRTQVMVSHQAWVAIAMLLPIVTVFICCGGLIVDILYSREFRAIVPFISVAIIGVPLRALSWCMAFSILARGDGKSYILTEFISDVANIVLNIFFFKILGFVGLGISYVIWYIVYTLAVMTVYCRRYEMRINKSVWALLGLCFLVNVCTLFLTAILPWWATLAVMLPPALLCSWMFIIKRKATSRRLLRRRR